MLLHLVAYLPLVDLNSALSDVSAGLQWLLPELYLAALLIIVLLVDVVYSKRIRNIAVWVALTGIALQLPILINQLTALQRGQGISLVSNMIQLDGFAVWFKLMAWFAAWTSCGFALAYPKLQQAKTTGEFAIIWVGLLLGMQFMAQAQHLLMMYLSLELTSICSYLLTVYIRTDEKAGEAAVKFILYGAVSSALMLFGISLLYGITGTLLPTSASFVASLQSAPAAATTVATILLLCGFAYKTALVPFHFWAPDVYEGAPTPVAALLSTGTKAAGFAMLARLVFTLNMSIDWLGPLLAIVAIITMSLGNLAALGQHNIKRLLAYSSIANAGYALMGIAVGTQAGLSATVYFLLLYVIGKLSAFIAASLFAEQLGTEDIRGWRGGAGALPLLTIALLILLVSLTGLPPTGGFVAKLYLFLPVWDHYQSTGQAIWLVLLVSALLNTVVSLFYYLRPLVFLVLHKQETRIQVNTTPSSRSRNLLVVAMALALLLLGVYGFDALFELVQTSSLTR